MTRKEWRTLSQRIRSHVGPALYHGVDGCAGTVLVWGSKSHRLRCDRLGQNATANRAELFDEWNDLRGWRAFGATVQELRRLVVSFALLRRQGGPLFAGKVWE